jgi:hypothetical protein
VRQRVEYRHIKTDEGDSKTCHTCTATRGPFDKAEKDACQEYQPELVGRKPPDRHFSETGVFFASFQTCLSCGFRHLDQRLATRRRIFDVAVLRRLCLPRLTVSLCQGDTPSPRRVPHRGVVLSRHGYAVTCSAIQAYARGGQPGRLALHIAERCTEIACGKRRNLSVRELSLKSAILAFMLRLSAQARMSRAVHPERSPLI